MSDHRDFIRGAGTMLGLVLVLVGLIGLFSARRATTSPPACDQTLVRQLGSVQARVIAREVMRVSREEATRIYDRGDPKCFTRACFYWHSQATEWRDAQTFMCPRDFTVFRDVDRLLYPQDASEYAIPADTWLHLREAAALKLRADSSAHPDVVAHWRKLAAGTPPFGLRVAASR